MRGWSGDSSRPSAFTRLGSDERGAILVLVAFSLVLLIAGMALTIDIGKQIRATAEAQATADASALAAAGVLAAVPGAETFAREEAKLYAKKNRVMKDPVDITDGDVTFFTSSGWDSVRVNVRRTYGSPDGPIASIFGAFFGIDSLEVERDAIAWVKPSGSPPECLMPFGIPDLWLEPGNTVADTGDVFDPDTDIYRAPSDNPTSYTGYQFPPVPGRNDWGRPVVIYDQSPGTAGEYNPSWWGMWHADEADSDRGSDFQLAVTGGVCGLWTTADFDEVVWTTPGTSTGPVLGCFDSTAGGCGSGGTPVIDQDPDASWAPAGSTDYNTAGCYPLPRGCIVRDENGTVTQISASPRIRPVALFHPADVVASEPGTRKQIRITNFAGVFFDEVTAAGGGRKVIGYVVGLVGSGEDEAPASGVTTRTIQLVE